MSQYTTGTISVTNGSPTVTGSGTLWLSNVTAGGYLTVTGSNVSYQIASIDSDTQLTLSSNYAGTTNSGLSYVIFQDFLSLGIPVLSQNDQQTAQVYSRAMQIINDLMEDFAVKVYLNPINAANLIDDTLTTPPGSFVTGDVFILGGAGSGAWAAFSSGEIVQYNGSTWDSLGILASGDRFGISIDSATSATNTFASKDNQVAEWNGSVWTYTVPSDLNAVMVDLTDLQKGFNVYLYTTSGSKWTQIGGGVSVQKATGSIYGVVKIGTGINVASGVISNAYSDLNSLDDVVITTPSSGQALTYSGSNWVNSTIVTDMESISDVTITSLTTGQVLKWDGAAWVNSSDTSGETNTASNVGTAGVGVFKQKTGVDLEFKKINAGSSKITITDDTGNSEVDIDVAEANLTLDNLGGTLGIAKGGTGQTTASAGFNALSPVTTIGDLIIGDGANSSTRLAIGTSGYVLTSNGTTASWAAPTVTDDWGLTSGSKLWASNMTASGNSVAAGTQALVIGSNSTISATSGSENIAIGRTNTITSTTSSSNVIVGFFSTTNDSGCIHFGYNNDATTGNTHLFGFNNSSSGAYGKAFGYGNTIANASAAIVGDNYTSLRQGEMVFPGSSPAFSAANDARSAKMQLIKESTSATPVYLTFGGGASADQKLTIQTNSVIHISGKVVAIRTDSGYEAASFNISATAKHDGTSYAAVGTPSATSIHADANASTWTMGVSVNSSGYFDITATGQAGKTIRWVANIDITEVKKS